MECQHLMNSDTCIDCNTGCCLEPKKLYEEDGSQWEFCGNCLEPYHSPEE